jgi:hypothetical protein
LLVEDTLADAGLIREMLPGDGLAGFQIGFFDYFIPPARH